LPKDDDEDGYCDGHTFDPFELGSAVSLGIRCNRFVDAQSQRDDVGSREKKDELVVEREPCELQEGTLPGLWQTAFAISAAAIRVALGLGVGVWGEDFGDEV
jgi:hypothetical protein